jgi:hypothetical protein
MADGVVSRHAATTLSPEEKDNAALIWENYRERYVFEDIKAGDGYLFAGQYHLILERLWKVSRALRTVGIPTEIPTRYLLHTRPEGYKYTCSAPTILNYLEKCFCILIANKTIQFRTKAYFGVRQTQFVKKLGACSTDLTVLRSGYVMDNGDDSDNANDNNNNIHNHNM